MTSVLLDVWGQSDVGDQSENYFWRSSLELYLLLYADLVGLLCSILSVKNVMNPIINIKH